MERAWGGNASAGTAAATIVGVLALAGCAHEVTVCPRGATLARRIYSGGSEAEWCHRDGDRVRQGADVRYYESGVKLMEGLFVDGVQHGTWRYYWNTGEMWRVEQWNDGELVEQKVVTRAAKMSVAEHSIMGFTSSGVIKIAAYDPVLRRHQLEQESRSFSDRYPDGTPRALGRYDGDGARWGVWWFWYPNGQLAREVEYQSGARHGGFREWYPDGHPRTDGVYFSGRKESHWRRWDGAGHLTEEADFHEGAATPPPTLPVDGPVLQSPP